MPTRGAVQRRIVDFKAISAFFLGGIAARFSEDGGRVVIAAGSFLLGWLVVYLLYRKNTFLKV